jgi:hypothetical protein
MKRPRWKTVGIAPERGDALASLWMRGEVDVSTNGADVREQQGDLDAAETRGRG